jgi:hypothetical protein
MWIILGPMATQKSLLVMAVIGLMKQAEELAALNAQFGRGWLY